MKPRSISPAGSLHPVIFFAVVYVVALALSIFICSSLFYSCNATGTRTGANEIKEPHKTTGQPGAAMAMR